MLYQRMFEAEQRQVVVLHGGLSAGRDAKPWLAVLYHFEAIGRNPQALSALCRDRTINVTDQAGHPFTTIVHLLVIVQAETLKVLEQFPNNLPRSSCVLDSNFQFLAGSHEPGIPNCVLIKLLVGQSF